VSATRNHTYVLVSRIIYSWHTADCSQKTVSDYLEVDIQQIQLLDKNIIMLYWQLKSASIVNGWSTVKHLHQGHQEYPFIIPGNKPLIKFPPRIPRNFEYNFIFYFPW